MSGRCPSQDGAADARGFCRSWEDRLRGGERLKESRRGWRSRDFVIDLVSQTEKTPGRLLCRGPSAASVLVPLPWLPSSRRGVKSLGPSAVMAEPENLAVLVI